MENSSEYHFPIFISSTDYNLKDLRAELARFLAELGYRPILSSSEGFPDNSPALEPWESCLPVLKNSFVMILVIDGKYGSLFEWPNFQKVFNKRKVSPTHAEYVFAHSLKKRMLVFIRDEVLTFYQSYRSVLKKAKDDDEAKKLLEPVLPKHIQFESLKFVNEVKTTKPIPWIKAFDDVTTIKREVQKKMLNELAELFMIKEKHLETVVKVFNRAMNELSPDKQKEILETINATKGLTEVKEALKSKESDLEKMKNELDSVKKGKKKDKEEKEKKVLELENQIERLKDEIERSESQSERIQLNSDGKLRFNSDYFLNPITGSTSSHLGLFGDTDMFTKKCDGCGNPIKDPLGVAITGNILESNSNHCTSCNRDLCTSCWPTHFTISGIDKCPKCEAENPMNGLFTIKAT